MSRNDRDDLRKLSRATEAEKDAAIARLREAALAREGTLAALRELDSALKGPEAGKLDTAFMVVAAASWDRWRQERRVALNTELARRTAEFEARRADAARAFGRARVATELAAARTGPNRVGR